MSRELLEDAIVSVWATSPLDLIQVTEERRLVMLAAGAAVGVARIGPFRAPLFFRNFDHVALVNVGPRRHALEIGKGLQTADGIPLSGEVSVELRVKDDDGSLRRLVQDPRGQRETFEDRVVACIAAALAKYSYADLSHFKALAPAQVVADFRARAQGGSLALVLIDVHLSLLETTDVELRDARLARRRLEETEGLRSAQQRLEAERDDLGARRRISEAQAKAEMQRVLEQADLDRERIRAEQQFALQLRKAELLKTEAGQMSEDLNAVLQHKERIAKIGELVAQLEDKQVRDMLRAVLSIDSSPNRVLQAIVAKQYSVKFDSDQRVLDAIASLSSEEAPGSSTDGESRSGDVTA